MSSMAGRTRRWLRFVMGGGVNTGATYLVYLGLNLLVSYQIAFFVAYAIGIAFAYWFNARFVFCTALSWRRFRSYPVLYLIQYASSALLLGGLIEFFDVKETVGPLLVAVLMIPVTYLMNKLFFVGNRDSGRR